MNKKGFTLMELLGVIVLLSLLAIISTVAVTKIVNSSKEQLSETQIKSIKISAEMWGADNLYYLPDIGECIYITLGSLKEYAILNENILDIKSNEKISDNLKIKITATENKFGDINYVYEVNSTDTENCPERPYIKLKNITTGITPTVDSKGDIVSGSEFSIKVNSTVGWLTFFVLSNDGDYVNLIAQKNLAPDGSLTGENQTGDEWYSSSQDNRYGPQTAYTYLSTATSNWTNIPVIESFNYLDEGNQSNSNYGYKGIITKLDETSGNYITTITPLSSNYGNPVVYENMRARLPYSKEITDNTSCTTTIGSCDDESLWITDYLNVSQNVVGGSQLNSYSFGYILLTTHSGYSSYVYHLNYNGYVVSDIANRDYRGIRPVITIRKSELLNLLK